MTYQKPECEAVKNQEHGSALSQCGCAC